MRVVMLCKACVVGIYQRKLEEIAARGIELTVVVPPAWEDRRGRIELERTHLSGYSLQVLPIRFQGNYHLYHFVGLGRLLDSVEPDLLHVDEEPYNLATWLPMRWAKRKRVPTVFFTWQNILRKYPPPFSWFERYAYEHSAAAIAGTEQAAEVLRKKGYRGRVEVIPQFGVDPERFSPGRNERAGRPFTVGYAGGLLPEKGIDVLLRAMAGLDLDWKLELLGAGEERPRLEALARELGIEERVVFMQRVPSERMPDFYRGLDLFVLPSLTTKSWKEQFGRVLVEAMSCGVPVIGSSSGAIPEVIGDAGVVFPEGDVGALSQAVWRIAGDAAFRRELSERGRRRVLERFTHSMVAEATVELYKSIVEGAK